MKRFTVLLSFFFVFLIVPSSPVFAQDTFGPICDGVTVTCPPTPPPTEVPTAPPAQQTQPEPTTPPQPPPVSGSAEMTLLALGISGLALIAGMTLRKAFV